MVNAMDSFDFSKRLIIAELGMTHDGSFGQAKSMMVAASECGVDAVKFQLHISSAETVRNAPQPPYFNSEPRYEYFERTAFSVEQWMALRQYAHELGVYFIVSPFSIEAIKILEDIEVDAIKVPSGEITNIPYLEYLAKSKLPVIISSGMSSIRELDECIQIFRDNGKKYALMQCTSEYPCEPEHVGLNILDLFKNSYPEASLGFSDHSSGVWASISAFLKGANIIEKHFTLSKRMYGPDAAMSMDYDEMKLLCESIKSLEIAINSPVDKSKTDCYESMKRVFQKSIVASCTITSGTVITENMLAYKKPGDGLETKYYKQLIGRRINRDMHPDDPFVLDDLTD